MSMTPDEISFVKPEIQLCPFPAYKVLHAENPVHKDPLTGFYEVTRFDDLWAVAQDPATYSSEHQVYGDQSHTEAQEEQAQLYREEGFPPTKSLIDADEPVHSGYRTLVDRSFKPRRIKALEPYIQELVDTLIDGFGDSGECEFVSAFAIPLPLYVIADTIGVSRDHAHDFKRWSDALVKVFEPGISGELQLSLTREVIEMQKFFAAEYDEAVLDPQENIIGDLATARLDGRALTHREVVALLQSILVAGNESTASGLGNCMRRLIETPGMTARLQADESLIPAFVEEVLRLDAPLQCQYRRPVKDVELSGTKVPADSIIVLRFGAGNRDESRFPNADAIELKRSRLKNHLTFGSGIHSCLGMLLARAELNIAVRTLVARLTNFRQAGAIEAVPSYMVYGPSKLPIAFDRR